MRLMTTSLIALLCCVANSAIAGEENRSSSFLETLAEGRPYIDARFRYEYVDQDGINEDAEAATLRIRAGYETPEFEGFSGLFEFEMVEPLGGEDYNSTTNGKTDYPVVADPDSSEVNQAYIQYTGLADTRIRAGRQAIKRGNLRFVGDVGWRQNNQTFDGVTVHNQSLPDTEIHYGYAYNVNRIFGDDHETGNFNGDIHMLDATYTGLGWARLSAYGILLDLENATALSSQTYGAALHGAPTIADGVKLPYRLEYAYQSDYGDNSNDYNTDYLHVNAGLAYKGVTFKGGFEALGSDNNIGFSTPLATLHKFNGWADKFLTTPADGLEDIYASLTYKAADIHPAIDGTKLMLAYHDFSAAEGGDDYGSEINVDISRKIMDHYLIGFRYADYDADSFATDTQKYTLTLGVQF